MMMHARATEAAAPWLLCLNLQREYATPGRPLYAPYWESVAALARGCLDHARVEGWRVAHVRSRRARLANDKFFARPIEGLEPSPSEPVYSTEHRSALGHPELRASVREPGPRAIYVIGFSLALDGLATLFHASDLGLPARIVAGAAGSPPIGDRNAADIDRAALAIAASQSGIVTSQELLGASPATLVRLRG
jgi:nicotinamidase-related amidase